MVGNDKDAAPTDGQAPTCPVCRGPLSLRIVKGRKSGKPFLMVICLQDSRHFRGFIGEKGYVRQIIDRLRPVAAVLRVKVIEGWHLRPCQHYRQGPEPGDAAHAAEGVREGTGLGDLQRVL